MTSSARRTPTSHPMPRASRSPGGRAGPGQSGAAPVPTVRVLCVDDHAVLVEGLRAQFSLDGRISMVGALATADRLLEEVARLEPHVVLLDIEMPGPDAFEMADRLHHLHPKVRVLILSAHVRDSYLAAAYRCGCCGYFAKSDDLSSIVEGVLQAGGRADGAFVMGPKVQERCLTLGAASPSSSVGMAGVPADAGAGPVTRLAGLSDRELEVLRLIGGGLSRTEIASQLSRSVKTIDGHQERLMQKLDITSRADLMRFAIREGLAEV